MNEETFEATVKMKDNQFELYRMGQKEDGMASLERSLAKKTFFLIKNWDSFQLALRTCLKPPLSRPEK